MNTEHNTLLVKARALATELRTTLEELQDDCPWQDNEDDAAQLDSAAEAAGEIESWLDEQDGLEGCWSLALNRFQATTR